ncbi:MAG: UPF0182 family protein [bacterium]|nr:UPF0182 family protein [bacterium]
MRRGPRIFRCGLVVLALLLATLVYGSYFYTEYLWFSLQGYLGVLVTMIGTRVALGILVGLIVAAILILNLRLAWGRARVMLGDYLDLAMVGPVPRRQAVLVLWTLPLVLAFLVGLLASREWLTVLKFIHRVPFGVPDPLFGLDAGFYLFVLPFQHFAYYLIQSAVVLSALGALGIYLLNRSVEMMAGRLIITARARYHLSALLALFLGLKAWGYRLAIYRLLYSPRGVTFGASYTDIHAQLPAFRIMTGLTLLVATAVLAAAILRRPRLALGGVGILVVASLVLGSLYPAFVQQFAVEPDEINRERPFIAHNIALTRYAYGLDRIEELEFPYEARRLDVDALERNRGTIDNIRLWDSGPVRQTYSQLQEIRLYYRFFDVDVDRYLVDGRLRQVLIAGRELSHAALPTGARTWVNMHLKYTHGYGAVVSPAAEVTEDGLPERWLRDVPPRTGFPELAVTRPEMYYGEAPAPYVVVNTREAEFDYPLGTGNAWNHYDGRGGVRLGLPLARLAFAVRERSYQLLLTGTVHSESRIMIYRQIQDRVHRLAPFLTLDRDPYLAIRDDGSLFFIQDAYTTSVLFPYSEPHPRGRFNYVRNSVKVTVDAYHGEVSFYLFDDDPVALTYARVFPGLLQPREAMPADLRRHVRYPVDLFNWQADVYGKYHMTDPMVFYNQEDLWQRPRQLFDPERASFAGGTGQEMEPYYLVMKLPGQPREEFVLLLPFTPARKDNMIGWMTGRSDGEHYGQALVYTLPKDQLIFGPMQIDARIDQDAYISQQLTLWGQSGSRVIRGAIQVIPIENTVMYVEPIYLQAEGNRLPEFRRVIVGYGERLAMEPTLDAALRRVFLEVAVSEPLPPWGDEEGATGVESLARRAGELWRQAQEAIRRGDWTAYGAALDELGRALERLEEATRQ